MSSKLESSRCWIDSHVFPTDNLILSDIGRAPKTRLRPPRQKSGASVSHHQFVRTLTFGARHVSALDHDEMLPQWRCGRGEEQVLHKNVLCSGLRGEVWWCLEGWTPRFLCRTFF